MRKLGFRKLIVLLAITASVHSLARYGILDGGNVVAIFCTALGLFNVGNAVEHVMEGKK